MLIAAESQYRWGRKGIGDYLGISPRAVTYYLQNHELPVYRAAGRLAADPAELDGWVRRRGAKRCK